jgi:hypothetical protein
MRNNNHPPQEQNVTGIYVRKLADGMLVEEPIYETPTYTEQPQTHTYDLSLSKMKSPYMNKTIKPR